MKTALYTITYTIYGDKYLARQLINCFDEPIYDIIGKIVHNGRDEIGRIVPSTYKHGVLVIEEATEEDIATAAMNEL